MKLDCFLSALLLATSCLAGARDSKSELQAQYNGLAKAFAHQDSAVFEAVLAKGFVLHIGKRTENRDSVLQDFKRQMASMSNTKWVRTVTGVKTSHGITVATVKSVFDGNFNQNGKSSHFWNSAVSTDSWARVSGTKWVLESSDLVSLDARVDGKPAGHFPPAKSG